MRYFKYLLMMCFFWSFSPVWAAVVKVDFDVRVTSKDEVDFDTLESHHIDYPNPIQGKYSLRYDTAKTEHIINNSLHIFSTPEVQTTGEIESVLSGNNPYGDSLIWLYQTETTTSGTFSSEILLGNLDFPGGIGIKLGAYGVNVKGLGLENFFYSALAEGYKFNFHFEPGPSYWDGNAVITNVTTVVPLPGSFWFFVFGIVMLSLLGQFKARHKSFSVSPALFGY